MFNSCFSISNQPALNFQRNPPRANIHRQPINLPLPKPEMFHPCFSGSNDAPTYKRGLEGGDGFYPHFQCESSFRLADVSRV